MPKREQEVNTSPSQIQYKNEAVNRTLDQARDNIKKTVNEARKDVSTYSEQFTNLQEQLKLQGISLKLTLNHKQKSSAHLINQYGPHM
jgi:outer membrane protein TolC